MIKNFKLKIKNFSSVFLRLNELLFLLTIFLLPTQLGKHFWPSWSLMNGIRVDYLSPTIYLTDILIFILLLITVFQKIKKLKFPPPLKSFGRAGKAKNNNYLAIFLIALGVILTVSFSPLSLIKFLKILEIVIFAHLIKIHLNKETFPQFIFALSLSLLFQSGLAIAQFFHHGSLNGIFYWFGERTFSNSTPGIANASINGALVLRPYGTFPHPNVLAGFLLVGIILVMQNVNLKMKNDNVKSKINLSNYFLIFVIIVSSFALLLTMSRATILLGAIFFFFYFIRRGRFLNPPSVIILSIILSVFMIFLFPRFSSLLSEDKQSWQTRLSQSKIAWSMWRDHPLLGVGLNHYLVELPEYMKATSFKDYQPVHNTSLLILAETGIFGFFSFLFLILKFLIFNFKFLMKISNYKFQIILIIFILSLFDHYFYTLQQGNLMIGLIIGLCASKF